MNEVVQMSEVVWMSTKKMESLLPNLDLTSSCQWKVVSAKYIRKEWCLLHICLKGRGKWNKGNILDVKAIGEILKEIVRNGMTYGLVNCKYGKWSENNN